MGTSTFDLGQRSAGALNHRNSLSDQAGQRSSEASESAKRSRAQSRSSMVYPRKRAITACFRCRARKTKCDNEHPVCGFCASIGVDCRYDDQGNDPAYDQASLTILGRLDEVLRKQDRILHRLHDKDQGKDLSCLASSGCSLDPPNDTSLPVESTPACQGDSMREKPWPEQIRVEPSEEYFTIPPSRTTPDSLLEWPIFGSRFPPDCFQSEAFRVDASHVTLGSVIGSDKWPGREGVSSSISYQESEICDLTDRFLSMVHTKNPILDEDALRQMAKSLTENGLAWDEPSCLVLLTCALGAIATPYEDARANYTLDPDLFRCTPSHEDQSRLRKAQSYYLLARRRIGLLRRSLLGSQCHFFSGVYLMYSLRPVEAYQEFHQASILYQLCLKSDHALLTSPQTKNLEQRMYWSCFKSECELLSELPLPVSGIADVRYPHLFPSPPEQPATTTSPRYSADSPGSSRFSTFRQADSPSAQRQHEQSWFYYLSEITLRRIGNQVLNTLYRQSSDQWKYMEVDSTLRVAQHFLRILDEWCEGAPELIRFASTDLETIPWEELPFMIRIRMLGIKSHLLRPFLYYAIHNEHYRNVRSLLQPLVDQSLQMSMYLIRNNSVRHRHHGTWYTCRMTACAALSLLAAASSEAIELPQGWDTAVRLAIEILFYWEKDAPEDLRRARMVLEELLTKIVQSEVVTIES